MLAQAKCYYRSQHKRSDSKFVGHFHEFVMRRVLDTINPKNPFNAFLAVIMDLKTKCFMAEKEDDLC